MNSIAQQAKNLLAKMTREEKMTQVQSANGSRFGLTWGKSPINDGYDPTLAERIRNGMGNLHTVGTGLPPSEQAKGFNHLQKIAVEESRLGIPLLTHAESLHGFRTMFPQAIALGSTWNPDLAREVFSDVALEMRTSGYHVTYSPVIDLATDPRWGRSQESYGECPHLVSRMAVAVIEGYQGGLHPETIDDEHVIACAKHFAGYAQSIGGRNFASVDIGPRKLHDQVLAPFRAAVTEAGMLGIMPGHHSIDGVPCHANDYLLRILLRETWGFKGIIVSDADDIRRLKTLHDLTEDEIDAGAAGLQHRIAVDILTCRSYERLAAVLERYPELETHLDRIVLDTLEMKFRLGLFDNPYVDPDRADRVCHQKAHISLARKAAEQCAILLKNDNDLLPLEADKIKQLAVIGPNADEIQCGTYGPNQGTNILEGLRTYASTNSSLDIVHAKGCHITTNTSGRFLEEDEADVSEDNPVLVSDEVNQPLIDEAAAVAAKADVVVLVLGGNNFTGREAFCDGDHRGDIDDLRLPGSQEKLLDAVAATGTPIVLILNHGNAHLIGHLLEEAQAALEIWFAGEETGNAVADILFGHVAPGGKTPVTFPAATGSVPCPYNQERTSLLKQPLFSTNKPAVSFGFGLSTTSFTLGTPSLSTPTIRRDDKLTLSLTVSNTGNRMGDEVVQVYLKDQVASVTRPRRQLIAFERITLAPKETADLCFDITDKDLQFTRADMSYGSEPGKFTLYVGTNSLADTELEFELIDY